MKTNNIYTLIFELKITNPNLILYNSSMSRQGSERKTPYILDLMQHASSVTAFKFFHPTALKDAGCVTIPLAISMGAAEFIMPATMRFVRENMLDDDRPLRNILLLVASISTDAATIGLIHMAGVDAAINVPARRIVLNYATHMGIDFIQHTHSFLGKVRHNYNPRVVNTWVRKSFFT